MVNKSGRKVRSDGDGSVYQRHDKDCPPLVDGVRPDHKCTKPWVGAYVVTFAYAGPGKKPKPVRRKVSAPTKAAATTKLNELKAASSALPVGRPPTVEEWMKHWLTKIAPTETVDGGRRVRSVKEGTVETYATNVNQYIIPLLGHHRLDRLTSDHIEDAWDQLLDEGNPSKPAESRVPLSPNSVHLAHSVLRRALKVAVQKKKLASSPASTDAMDAPPAKHDEVEPIPFADVKKILAATEGDPYEARWSVALSLGLRPGEARGLRWDDVDLKTGRMTVAQQLQRRKGRGLVSETPKSKSGIRDWQLPASLLTALKAHKKAQNELKLKAGDQWQESGLVFTLENGRPIDAKVDRERWHALLKRAGVTQRRLYDARHSAATMLLAQDVPPRVVMYLLGHSSMQVTSKYQHAVEEFLADAAAKVEQNDWTSVRR